ncbi:MAG: 50S ribosomal protein L3 [bacterium]
MHGIIGRKKGMTQVFAEDGSIVPVTIIQADPLKVAQIRTPERDGYAAVQVASFETTEKRIGKPQAGHLKKAGLPALRRLTEFRVASVEGFSPGQEIRSEQVFTVGERVDVRGVSKGRGFAGVIKRHHFSRGDHSHGGMSRRRHGSIGQCADPSRVFRGKRMAGHMGVDGVTIRNLELVRIDTENCFLLVRGAVPGAVNAEIVVTKTKKGKRVPKHRAA